jgi:hypothetical protein
MSNKLFEEHKHHNNVVTTIEQDGKFFNVVGKHRVSDIFDTKKSAFNDAKKINWVQICALVQTMIDK